MKKISREEQMMKNGGKITTWHCHACGKDYYASSEKKARKNAQNHCSNNHKRMVAIWDFGSIYDCKNL